MTTTLSNRDQALADVFTTALEGGIGYWSEATLYHWSDEDGNAVADFRAEIDEVGDGDEPYPHHVIDRAVIGRGLTRFYRHMTALGDQANQYQRAAAVDLTFGNYDDLDFDADTGDMIVQLGLFNEIRYG